MTTKSLREGLIKIVKWIVEDAPNYSDYEEEVDALEALFSEHIESVIGEIEKMEGIHRGRWLIHPDWISRKEVIAKLKNK